MSANASVKVKICGITDARGLEAAISAGADYVGLVFFPPSPRHLEIAQAARLADAARGRVKTVALTVDAKDDLLRAISENVRPDLVQLHGKETPARVNEISKIMEIPLIKAFRIRNEADIKAAEAYEGRILFPLFDAWADEKAAQGLPGGTGHAFDWSLLKGYEKPYMLAGGLTPENIQNAIRLTGAPMVDVSSGVESARGVKSPQKIRAFIKTAKG